MEYGVLHGRAKEALDRDPCVVDQASQLASCIEERLRGVGFRVRSVQFLDSNVDPVDTPERARFIRVEASAADENTHVFTFAVLKPGGRYKALWLQSAVIER